MKNLARAFVASWFLWGWAAHVYLALTAPQTYTVFGETALFPLVRQVWQSVIMPNISGFAMLLAGFELVTGVLICSQGVWVRLGLLAASSFALFLVVLGLSYPAPNMVVDFQVNRLPNILLFGLELALLNVQFDRSLPRIFADWIRRFMGAGTPRLR